MGQNGGQDGGPGQTTRAPWGWEPRMPWAVTSFHSPAGPLRTRPAWDLRVGRVRARSSWCPPLRVCAGGSRGQRRRGGGAVSNGRAERPPRSAERAGSPREPVAVRRVLGATGRRGSTGRTARRAGSDRPASTFSHPNTSREIRSSSRLRASYSADPSACSRRAASTRRRRSSSESSTGEDGAGSSPLVRVMRPVCSCPGVAAMFASRNGVARG
jgi:hypothetical protein